MQIRLLTATALLTLILIGPVFEPPWKICERAVDPNRSLVKLSSGPFCYHPSAVTKFGSVNQLFTRCYQSEDKVLQKGRLHAQDDYKGRCNFFMSIILIKLKDRAYKNVVPRYQLKTCSKCTRALVSILNDNPSICHYTG